jgi:sugar lactone lactonase YvrE
VTLEVVSELRAALGEGALWDAELARLLWVDILGHRVFVLDPKTGTQESYDVGEEVGTVVVTGDGNLLVALRHRIARLDPRTGALADLVAVEPERGDTRCNDGKCDPAGRLWVGTMVEGPARGSGALYCLDPTLSLERRLGDITISNGIAWSLDGRRMYYIDTPRQRVEEFAFDVASGTLGAHRVVIEIPPELGAPDGMTIDAEGCLWIALWGGGAVLRVEPNAGRLLQKLPIPVTNVTSCAFGGPDLGDLYVTTARRGPGDEEPLAGALLRHRASVRGVPATRFAGSP